MKSSPHKAIGPRSRLHSLADFALFGGAIGFVHGLADVNLLRLAGLKLGWPDAVIAAAALGLGGAAAGLAVGLLFVLVRPAWAADPGVRRGVLLGGASLAYAAIVGLTVGGGAGLGLALAGLGASAVVIGQARKANHGGAVAAAAVAISGIYCALFLIGVEWGEAAETARWPLAAVCAAFAVVAVAWFAGWSRLRSPAAVSLLAWTALSLLWVELAPLDRYPWRTIERAPALGAVPPAGGNLLLVVLDTVRADHMDLFGYERETMPLLTARVRRDFDVAMKSAAASPWTLPSHATMFTGLHPWKHGAHRASVLDPNPPANAYPLRPDARVLAEVMADSGYRTANIAANFAILSGYGLTKGFEHADITPGTLFLYQRLSWLFRMRTLVLPPPGYLIAAKSPAWLKRRSGGFNDRVPSARRAAEITGASVDWLDANGQRPFFLFVNYLDPHAPYLPVPEDDERFVRRPADELPMAELKDRFMDQVRGKGEVSAEQLEFVEGQYDAEMVGMDRALEELLADLERRGLYDDTLIIVTSDHGESFMEHGVWGHETLLYESQIGVPLLIKLPLSYPREGVPADPSMQHVDLLPTIAAVLGVEAPPGMQGSPWGVGRGYALSEVYCYACRAEPASDTIELFRRDLSAVVIDGRKALLSTRDPAEYYDLTADPMEQSPLRDPPAELVEGAARVTGSREIYVSDSGGEADPEMVEKLKSLGYIQ